jgi:4-amino-4-deoxy-L-arabinose transferase-like glycosyltransferase
MKAKPSRTKPGLSPLWILCAAFTILVFLHASFSPIFEAPDEVWHYAYVRWLARGKGLPALDNNESGANQEVAQPPLAYLLAAAISRPLTDDEVAALMWHNPGFGYQAAGTSADNKNMLIHRRTELGSWSGAAGAVRTARAASWLFGLLAVVSAWALGYEATGNRRWALVTASLVAFHPQFVFISSVMSNDSAAAALATAALWFAARSIKRMPTLWDALVAGIIAGLGSLAKVSLLPVVPLLGAALIWGTLQHEDAASPRPRQARAVLVVSGYAVVTALVGGWWYLRNALRYGDPLALMSHTETLWGRAAPVTLAELLPEVPLVARSFWGAYGWGHVLWPEAVYVVLWSIALPLLILAVARLGRDWISLLRDPVARRWSLLPLRIAEADVLPATLALLWLTGISAALLRWMQQVEAPHGRLLFPALGAWALLISLGLRHLTRVDHRLGRAVAALYLCLCALLSTLAPGARIAATFFPPRPLAPSRVQATCDQPVDLRYGEKAQLLCAEIAPDRVIPGDQVTVRACWAGLTPMAQDYTVFVQLIGQEASRVLERQTYPGLGRYPTSIWRPGEAFCDTYVGSVAEWAEAPIRYHVEVGLFDARSGERLVAQTAEGHPLDPPIVGAVSVVPTGTQVASSVSPVDVTFDDSIRLTGYEMPQSAEPGSAVTVTLTWSARAEPAHDYIAFVHLWQPGDPAPLAQHDSRPRGGWFPTSAWRAGDLIRDAHTFWISETLPSGEYPVWAGLYRPESGDRLAASSSGGHLPYDLVPLGSLHVRDR